VTPPFEQLAKRFMPEGNFAPANAGQDVGLLFRPIITQISRWDRLKGFLPLMKAFVKLKKRYDDPPKKYEERHRQRLRILRLVLSGPEPESIQDDPESQGILNELCAYYIELPRALKEDIALLTLPMASKKENALMVNALQRCATVVIQNSIREGFGLTATEAMWKRVPTIGTYAFGLRHQIRHEIDGLLIENPESPDEITDVLDEILEDAHKREVLARNGQRRVHEEFLIFGQLRRWLRLLNRCAKPSTSYP
jgi:trehalose synthase